MADVVIYPLPWEEHPTFTDDKVKVFRCNSICQKWSDKSCYEDNHLSVFKCEQEYCWRWSQNECYSDSFIKVFCSEEQQASVVSQPTAIVIQPKEKVEESSNIFDTLRSHLNTEEIHILGSETTQTTSHSNGQEILGSQRTQTTSKFNEYKEKVSLNKRKQKNAFRSCCVHDCDYDSGTSLHTFPSVESRSFNLQRCKSWIQNCGDLKLLEIPSKDLFKKKFICRNHFESNQFHNSNCKRLRIDAIPTIFNSPKLTNEQMEVFPVCMKDGGFEKVSNVNTCLWESNNESSDSSELMKCNVDSNVCNFENEMKHLTRYNCKKCKETFLSKQPLNKNCLHNNSCKDYTEDNNMDPGFVPAELSNLSMVEEQLIAKVNPIISVYQIKGQQYAYSGNVINFPQEVTEICKQLPRKVSDLHSVLTVRAKNKEKDTSAENESVEKTCQYIDFHVQSERVRKALLWLKQNNPYYYDIEISEDNLSLLPEDGNVFDLVNGFEIENEDSINLENLGELQCDDDENIQMEPDDLDLFENLEDSHNTPQDMNEFYESCVPNIALPNQDEQIANIIDWPTIGTTPIDEFTSKGYIVQAFPTLFPTGKADLKDDRKKKINPAAYFKHLMRYEDERFSKHSRFKYFALNSLMRWTAINDGNMYVRKEINLRHLSVRELKEKTKEDPTILRKVMFHCNNLKGTKPYWRTRAQELIAMINQLGMPTVFLTLSAADHHWPDLYKILSPTQDVNQLTDQERRKLLVQNPMIVDKFFAERVESYIKQVLVPKFQVQDFWYRVEYQHRGSPHIHGVFWFKDAPNVLNLKHDSEDYVETVIQYFDNVISTMHPDITALPATVHPCRVRLHEIINFEQDLAQILNKVQRHTKCSESYCIRWNKKTKKNQCRFDFPKEVSDCSKIEFDEEEIKFISKRNDPLLNKYNQYIMQSWRANIDISPVLSKNALVSYLAKYVSKSESKSKDFQDIIKSIFDKCDENKNVKSFIQKLYISTCSERDYSSQEVSHLLMGEKLYSAGGREFVHLNFNSKEEWILIEETEHTNKRGKSFIEKYCERKIEFEQMSLWHMAKNYHLPAGRKRKKSAIVQIFPNLQTLQLADKQKFCRFQVLLFVPWRDETQFPTDIKSWEEIYIDNENTIETQRNEMECLELNTNHSQNEDDENDNTIMVQQNDQHDSEEWMIVSKMGPQKTVNAIELGSREIDKSHDWSTSYEKYNKNGDVQYLRTFIKNAKTQSTQLKQTSKNSNIVFNKDQKCLIDLVKSQISKLKSHNDSLHSSVVKRTIVQGKAGTGKSVCIQTIANLLNEALGDDSYVLCAPTGVAALNINGLTIHSMFHLPKNFEEYEPLKGAAGKQFATAMKNIKFIIIDEYSMVGCTMLGMIDKRCREATNINDIDILGSS